MTPKYQVGDVVFLHRCRDGKEWTCVGRVARVGTCAEANCMYKENNSKHAFAYRICPGCDRAYYTLQVLAGTGNEVQVGYPGDWAGFDMRKLTDGELSFYLM